MKAACGWNCCSATTPANALQYQECSARKQRESARGGTWIKLGTLNSESSATDSQSEQCDGACHYDEACNRLLIHVLPQIA